MRLIFLDVDCCLLQSCCSQSGCTQIGHGNLPDMVFNIFYPYLTYQEGVRFVQFCPYGRTKFAVKIDGS